MSAFRALTDVVAPAKQRFTNIGGLTGYHAELEPVAGSAIEKVEATITLLARESWLYYPFSRLMRRYDRLFVMLSLADRCAPSQEGHLIEDSFSRFRGEKVVNAASLQREEIGWGKLRFLLYSSGQEARDRLRGLMQRIPDPGPIRHIALVPEKRRAFLFMIPVEGEVQAHFAEFYDWALSNFEHR